MTQGPSRIGTVVADRYEIGDELGAGGMSSVHRAHDRLSGKAVAIKILRPELGSSDEAGARFHREAFVGGQLVHPNCVGVDDLGWCDDGAIYLVMELLEGESLGDVVARGGKMPWRRALHIARHVLRGLAHAHAQGVVHRDIKPDNVFLTTRDGDPDFARVLDFGIAKLLAPEAGPALTAAGLTVGTPDYLSPEQAQGTVIDGRTDLYAVSVMVFEMLTGAPPFHDDDLMKILTAHASKPVPPIGDPDVPAAVEQLVRDGMAKRPEYRIVSAEAYLARIDALLAPPADASVDPVIGTVLDGRYRLEAVIGRGAWGRVYRATHLGLVRAMAVKVLEPQVLADDDARKRFEREAQAAGKLRHPNCVAVTDFGATPDGGSYLAMELVEGVGLDARLDDETRLPVARAVHIMRHVLRGLGHAHGEGVVHRDLKPPNIMLTTEGGDRDFAKILDFGLAKMVANDDRITRTGIVCGTPRYMSPEQALDRKLDGRADLYAASVILYEMIAGRTPYDGDSAIELLKQHLESEVPALADVAPDVKVPRALEELLRRGLAKDPEDRPATASQYLLELERACATDATLELSMIDPAILPALATPAPPPRPRTPPRFTRRQLVMAAAGGIVVVGLIAAIATRSSSGSASARAVEPEDDGLVLEAEDVPSLDPEIASALALAGKGREEDAATKLRELRKKHPDNAQIPYALGRVYRRLGWPKQTIESYQAAARLDPALREDPALIRDLVALLASKSTWQQAARVLEEDIGKPALPALTETAAHHRESTVRGRAAKLRDRLSR